MIKNPVANWEQNTQWTLRTDESDESGAGDRNRPKHSLQISQKQCAERERAEKGRQKYMARSRIPDNG